jgi:hypothetical protein
MKLNKVVAVPALALAAGISLAACGTTTVVHTPAVMHTVTAAPKPAVTHTVTAAPKPVATTAAPVPAAPAAAPPVQHVPDQDAQTACGSGIYAGPSTSCAFAFDVVQAYRAGGYWYQPGTSYFTADGQSMTSASVGNPVIVTSGSGNLIYFNY